MRIYACADMHSHTERFDTIKSRIHAYRPDVVVAAGDFGTRRDPESAIAELNRFPVRVLAVRGNFDPPAAEGIMARYANVSSLNLREIEVGGCAFAGVSGAFMLPFRTRVRLREGRARQWLLNRVGAETILVSHPPPRGVRDMVAGRVHAGSGMIADVVASRQPRLVICGHIHEAPGIGRLGRTMVVNCAVGRRCSGAIIEIDGERLDVTML